MSDSDLSRAEEEHEVCATGAAATPDAAPGGNTAKVVVPPNAVPGSSGVPGGQVVDARREEFTPATLKQKIVLAVLLVVVTSALAPVWFHALAGFIAMNESPVLAPWKMDDGLALQPGKTEVWYDTEQGQLSTRGPIEHAQTQELLGLLVDRETGERAKATQAASYWTAVSTLRYRASERAAGARNPLLWLAGLSGVLGVLMRSLTDFVGNACFKNSLDVSRWWPWYALRVPLGFLVGLTVVVLVEAGWVTPEGQVERTSVWWLGIAIIAGFGTAEFAERLRLISVGLFGKS